MARRGAWIAFRELVEAECAPLTRADAWWEFEAKQPWWEFELERDWPISLQTLALERLGELTAAELALLEATRRTRDEEAAEREQWYREYDKQRTRVHLVRSEAAHSSRL